MKLFYDSLVPYMPDTIKDTSGQLVKDGNKQFGRLCMIDLANFQNSQDIMLLSLSIIHACNYAEVDLIDIVIATKDQEVPDISANSLLDDAVILLFKSIRDSETFEVVKFAAYILTVFHMIMNSSEK